VLRCAIYIRKSREERDRPGYRLEAQRAQLPEHAEAQGWDATVYDDGYASAARGKVEDLKERARLEADIRAGLIDIILVIELSRLSRDETLEDFVRFLALCAEHGVKLATPSRVLDPAQHSDWMLLLLEGGFSSVEMKVLQARMAEGRSRAYETGAYIGGAVPAGYRLENGHLYVVEADAAVIRQALVAVAASPSIADAARKTGVHYEKLRMWVKDAPLDVWLARRPSRERPGEWVRCQWPAIIDEALADRVRAGRTQTDRKGRGGQMGLNLLTGLGILRCGYCGGAKRCQRGGDRKDGTHVRYYSCYDKFMARWNCARGRAHAAPELDAKVVGHMLHTLGRHDLRTFYQAPEAETSVEVLDIQQADLEKQRARLVDAIAQGVLDLDVAKDKLDAIQRGLADVRRQRERIAAAKTEAPDWDRLQDIPAAWQTCSIEEQKEILSTLLAEIRVFANYAILRYHVPVDANGRTEARIHLDPPHRGKRKW
jgi:DNA invertase Pin-like site-specific DNA recombinase